MKTSILVSLAASATLAIAKGDAKSEIADSLSPIPSCGFFCLPQGAKAAGCKDEQDVKCICAKETDVLNGMGQCQTNSCGLPYVDISNTQFGLDSLCDYLKKNSGSSGKAGDAIESKVKTATAEATNTDLTYTSIQGTARPTVTAKASSASVTGKPTGAATTTPTPGASSPAGTPTAGSGSATPTPTPTTTAGGDKKGAAANFGPGAALAGAFAVVALAF